MTMLENRRAVPEKPYSFIYDAIFTCAENPAVDGIGSFRCFVGRDKTKKQDNLYQICAKVRYILHLTPSFTCDQLGRRIQLAET